MRKDQNTRIIYADHPFDQEYLLDKFLTELITYNFFNNYNILTIGGPWEDVPLGIFRSSWEADQEVERLKNILKVKIQSFINQEKDNFINQQL